MIRKAVSKISKAFQSLCLCKNHGRNHETKFASTKRTVVQPAQKPAASKVAATLLATDVASILVAGMPAAITANTNVVHILDPTHNFTATMASKSIQERRESEMILSLFVLARRTGAAIVKNVHRDIETLGRLSGISILSPKHEGMKWWRKQIGAAYESIPREVWNAALAMATEDLQARVRPK